MFRLLVFICFCLLGNVLFAQANCDSVPSTYSGFCKTYHSNGSLAEIREYKEGKPAGTWLEYDRQGKLMAQTEVSKQGSNFIEEHALSWNEPIPLKREPGCGPQPKDPTLCEYPEKEAGFKGGTGELLKYIVKNLDCNFGCGDLAPQGKIYLSFIVEKDGSISSVVVMRGIPDCPECEKATTKLIREMPAWIPAECKGEKVRTKVMIPINIGLQ